jgi:ABC-type glycerol-3-phosphate transport system substrate-binding protein
MKRIRVVQWTSVLTVLALLLVGCARATTVTKPAEKEPAKEEAPPAVEVVTLRVWDFGGDEFEWIDSLAKPAFEKEHPNIVIEHLGVPESDYRRRAAVVHLSPVESGARRRTRCLVRSGWVQCR